ncbi:hypothetical protein [Streptomyces rubiginosohelvolus]|uniref:hypothetical protein n=1 Tax=Streptomyces rubiginosohelvolus TaxID=67362 RepID=UPI0035DE857D
MRDRAPVVFEEAPGTSSRLHPLQRPKFGDLLTCARPGDPVHISEVFCLVRGNQHIFDILEVLHRDQLVPRIHDGAFSATGLTARPPRTCELLPTIKFMVQTLAGDVRAPAFSFSPPSGGLGPRSWARRTARRP